MHVNFVYFISFFQRIKDGLVQSYLLAKLEQERSVIERQKRQAERNKSQALNKRRAIKNRNNVQVEVNLHKTIAYKLEQGR